MTAAGKGEKGGNGDGQQTTLYDYHNVAEFSDETSERTLIIPLHSPTQRKRERIESALAEATEITAEAARRLPSVPRERWGSARPKRNTWYKWAKEIDHDLSNKTALANIQFVREAFRRWQSEGYDGSKPRFRGDNRCSFDHEQPKYEVYDDQYYLSLPFGAGRGQRELLPIHDGEYIRERVDAIEAGEFGTMRSDLLRREDGYEFHQKFRESVEVLANPRTRIGVDVGLTNLAAIGAVTAEGEKCGAHVWSGGEAAQARERFYRAKKHAQTEQKYEAIRDDEQRYVEHLCHTISREVVEFALDQDRPEIVMEDLTHIRDRFIERERDYTPEQRRVLHSWPFRKLQDMIEYKAEAAGIPVEFLSRDETRFTSQECSDCGHVAEENREAIYFECAECGYANNADINAGFVIGQRRVDAVG